MGYDQHARSRTREDASFVAKAVKELIDLIVIFSVGQLDDPSSAHSDRFRLGSWTGEKCPQVPNWFSDKSG